MKRELLVGLAPCRDCGVEIVSTKSNGFFPMGGNTLGSWSWANCPSCGGLADLKKSQEEYR